MCEWWRRLNCGGVFGRDNDLAEMAVREFAVVDPPVLVWTDFMRQPVNNSWLKGLSFGVTIHQLCSFSMLERKVRNSSSV
jgi:hypothetical protein